jgi:hypothetical protein
MDGLSRKGYECEPQIGASSYRIDIGVHHPDYPGEFVMGVECDGATYHSSKSARDRDKLRESVLVGLGWRIERIWSPNWFDNPQQEIERIAKLIEKARAEDRKNREPYLKPKENEDLDASVQEIEVDSFPDFPNSHTGVALHKLIDLGRDRGYLTHTEINEELPDELLSSEKIANIIAIFEEFGISVREDEIDSDEEVKPEEQAIEEEIIDNTPPEEKIEKQLIELRKYVESDFPDTEPERRLLTDERIKAFIAYKPTTFQEYRTEIPLEYRATVLGEEAQSFLPEVFEIINNA